MIRYRFGTKIRACCATRALAPIMLVLHLLAGPAYGSMKDFLVAETVTLPHPLQAGQPSFCTLGSCTLGPRLYHEPLPDGSTLVGWTDNTGNGHVTKVPESGAQTTWDFTGEATRGLVAHTDGSFAVLLYQTSTESMRLSKRDAVGAQVWSAPLISTMAKPAFLVGDGRLAYGNGQYDAYFSVLGLPGCFCNNSYGDQYWQINDGGSVTMVWFYGQTSHSMAQLAGYHPGLNRHTLVTVSDCFPSKGLLADGSHLLFLGDANCNGSVSVQLGGMAAGAVRWAVAFNAATSGASVGHGIGVAFFGSTYTPSIHWMTGAAGLQERDASIARLGGANAPERYLVGWRYQDTGVYQICVMDSVGAIVEGPEEIGSVGARWGIRDDSFRTRPNGGVSWVEGDAGSGELRIHIYDPFGTIAVGEPSERSPRSVTASPNPFRSKTVVRFGASDRDPVTVAVYDLQGRLVRRLIDQYRQPTERVVEWDGRDDHGSLVGSGLYLLRVASAGGDVSTRVAFLR